MLPRLLPPSPVRDDAEFDGTTHRIWLSRCVDMQGPVGLIIGLNPSTAGANNDDQTIRKEKEFAHRWGWAGFWKVNLFTVIETKSQKLRDFDYKYAVGDWGSLVLERQIPLASAGIVVCWGASVPKALQHRAAAVCSLIKILKHPGVPVMCFGETKDGHPIHPSRLSYETKLVPFRFPIQGERPSLNTIDD